MWIRHTKLSPPFKEIIYKTITAQYTVYKNYIIAYHSSDYSINLTPNIQKM